MQSTSIQRPMLGSRDELEKLPKLRLAARRAQRVPVAVAPMVSLSVVRDGKAIQLHAADEVRATDFFEGRPIQHVLWRLAEQDAVLVLDSEELARLQTAPTARFVVADGGAVSCKRGIISDGCEVRPDDFERGQLDVDDLIARGAILDRERPPQPEPKSTDEELGELKARLARLEQPSKSSKAHEPPPPKAA